MLTATSEGSKRELIPAGMHTAVCFGVVDLGVRKSEFNGKEKWQRKVMILWELPDETTETENGPVPRTMSKQYNLSLHEKSALYQMLSAWRNKAFTEEELAGFDLRNIIGQGCQLSVSHETSSKGNTYANIKAVVGLPKGMPVPEPTHYLIFDLDDENALAAFEQLPEWLQERIKEGQTYQALVQAAEEPWPADDGEKTDQELPF